MTATLIEHIFTAFNVNARDALVKNSKRKGYSHIRYQNIINARCVLMAIMIRQPKWSTDTLVQLFGFTKNTVINSIRRILEDEALYERYIELIREIDRLNMAG